MTGRNTMTTSSNFYFFSFWATRKSSANEGTERTWFEPEQRPRKRVPKAGVPPKTTRDRRAPFAQADFDYPEVPTKAAVTVSAPYAFSGHHQGSSPTTFTTATATAAAGTGVAFSFVGTSSSIFLLV